MVAKLLSDPTYFPIEFRRWLKDYIENSDIKVSEGQIVGGGGGSGSTDPTDFPAGIILPYAGTSFGKDCLPCNGASLDRVTYADLFAAIGTLWGSADSTHFNVPDLRSRALYGIGSTVGIGQTDGRGNSNRGGPVHSHSVSGNTDQSGGHTHGVQNSGDHTHGPGFLANLQNFPLQSGAYSFTVGSGTYGATSPGGTHSHTLNAVGNHSHPFSGQTGEGYDTKPSYAGVQYVITTGVVP